MVRVRPVLEEGEGRGRRDEHTYTHLAQVPADVAPGDHPIHAPVTMLKPVCLFLCVRKRGGERGE